MKKGVATKQPPAKAGGFELRTKVRIRVEDPYLKVPSFSGVGEEYKDIVKGVGQTGDRKAAHGIERCKPNAGKKPERKGVECKWIAHVANVVDQREQKGGDKHR